MTEFTQTEISAYYQARVPGIKMVGGKLRAPCPIHQGKDLNFSIDGTTGQWYCHSQCDRGADMIALEMELFSQSFGEAKESVFAAVGRTVPNFADRDIEATYNYIDEESKLLYQVVRKTGKRFLQRRPEGEGWNWKLNGVRQVPFNLPALIRAKGAIIAEGERDCLNLMALGFVATTNSGGAGNFRPELIPHFAGKHIVILPDNDEPGQKHGNLIASMLDGVAASIKIVNLPGLADKGDVSDYLASGKTVVDLARAFEAAPEWKQKPAPEPALPAPAAIPLAQALPVPEAEVTAPEKSNVTGDLEFLGGKAMQSPDACYAPELARAMAVAYEDGTAGTIAADAMERKLKARWEKDLNLVHFRKQIKTVREQLRAEVTTQFVKKTQYILTKEGGIKSNLANTITMMEEIPLRFNSFSQRVFLTAPSPWKTNGNWSDFDDIKAAEWCQHKYMDVEKRTTADAAEAVARGRDHYHPVKEYLTAQVWDGVRRLDTWLHVYLGVPLDEYSRGVAVKWMMSGVARVYEPGCQADYTLVLEGKQGLHKSTALRVLGGEWFTDEIGDIHNKDAAIGLQGKWIAEIAELDAFRKAEMTTIRAWLVRREDHFRPPYGRRAEDFPRQNIFAATTNKEDWGTDDAGLRRFWPVRVGEIDIPALVRDRDQLWAEAVIRYKAGELIFFERADEEAATVEQKQRQELDPWYELVEQWCRAPQFNSFATTSVPTLSKPDNVYLPEVLGHCLRLPEKDWNNAHKNRVSRILTLAGYHQRRAGRGEFAGLRPQLWSR